VFLALESLVRSRWRSAVVLAGAATAFHVLVGGWSLIALVGAWCLADSAQRPAARDLIPAVAAAGLFSLLGVLPALSLSWSADSEIVRQADQIYVFERLGHHLVFHALPPGYIARHVAIVLCWLVMTRWLRRGAPPCVARLAILNGFVASAVAIAVVGALLDQLLLYARPWAAALLRFYWFRLSDVMVPLGATWALAACVDQLSRSRPRCHVGALASMLLAVASHAGYVAWQHVTHPYPHAIAQSLQVLGLTADESERRYREWRQVCEWIRRQTRPDDLFLTPRHQQTFKWYAGRSEVICAKDIPQDAAGIVEWRRRMADVFPWSVGLFDLAAHREEGLIGLAEKYRFQYVVIVGNVS
jgi:hypothetical protein